MSQHCLESQPECIWPERNKLTIDLVGAVDDCIGGVCVSDEVHAVLFTVESSLRSVSQQQQKKKVKKVSLNRHAQSIAAFWQLKYIVNIVIF